MKKLLLIAVAVLGLAVAAADAGQYTGYGLFGYGRPRPGAFFGGFGGRSYYRGGYNSYRTYRPRYVRPRYRPTGPVIIFNFDD